MNELELIASLRDEVPLRAGTRVEQAVLTEIAAWQQREAGSNRSHRAARPERGPASRRLLRPAIVGALAVAVGAGTYGGVALSGSGQSGPNTVAWSGRPTAPWPSTAHPSYGRAASEAQLIAYVTRAAAAVPGRAPKPDEWVVVRT